MPPAAKMSTSRVNRFWGTAAAISGTILPIRSISCSTGENVFESLQVKEVNNILDALEAGAKLTYIDIRATVTASKADKFLMIRPGTDYALNLALIHVILKERLYDVDFVSKWVTGLAELESFVAAYTPVGGKRDRHSGPGDHRPRPRRQRVQAGSDIPRRMDAGPLRGFILQQQIDLHPQCPDGEYRSKGRADHCKGGKDAGAKSLHSLGENIPEVKDKIVDAEMAGKSMGTGHIVNLYKAIRTGQPYPIKAFLPTGTTLSLPCPTPRRKKDARQPRAPCLDRCQLQRDRLVFRRYPARGHLS